LQQGPSLMRETGLVVWGVRQLRFRTLSLAQQAMRNRGRMKPMATVHISEIEAARDFAGLLAKVRAGAEVVIESGSNPVVVLRVPTPPRRSIEECIALLPADSKAIIDEDFAVDVASAVAAHREPLNPPAWD